MIWLLAAIASLFASALVAVCVGTCIAAGHDADRRDRRERHLINLVAAARTAEGESPMAELKALQQIEREGVRDPGAAAVAALLRERPLPGDPFVAPDGEPAIPNGMQ